MIPLCQTARRHKKAAFPILLVRCHLKQSIDALLLGITNETTGVYHNDLCILFPVCDRESILAQGGDHHLTVHQILIAAKRHKKYIHVTLFSISHVFPQLLYG